MIKDFIIKLMKKAHEEVADEDWKHCRRTLSQAYRTLLRSSTHA